MRTHRTMWYLLAGYTGCYQTIVGSARNRDAPNISIRSMKYVSIVQPLFDKEADGSRHEAGSGRPSRISSGIALL
jgi:hypothetical protein